MVRYSDAKPIPLIIIGEVTVSRELVLLSAQGQRDCLTVSVSEHFCRNFTLSLSSEDRNVQIRGSSNIFITTDDHPHTLCGKNLHTALSA